MQGVADRLARLVKASGRQQGALAGRRGTAAQEAGLEINAAIAATQGMRRRTWMGPAWLQAQSQVLPTSAACHEPHCCSGWHGSVDSHWSRKGRACCLQGSAHVGLPATHGDGSGHADLERLVSFPAAFEEAASPSGQPDEVRVGMHALLH
jgi:hypothetical protein